MYETIRHVAISPDGGEVDYRGIDMGSGTHGEVWSRFGRLVIIKWSGGTHWYALGQPHAYHGAEFEVLEMITSVTYDKRGWLHFEAKKICDIPVRQTNEEKERALNTLLAVGVEEVEELRKLDDSRS
jgi:hypothetical protein